MPLPFFILTLLSFFISIAGGFIAALFIKNNSSRFLAYLIFIHVAFFILWIVFRNNIDTAGNYRDFNYLFLAFFCTGIFIAGILLRSGFPIWSKIYFSAFLLSIPVFIFSPAAFLGFIASGKLNTMHAEKFQLNDNLFLVEQSAATEGVQSDGTKLYKLIKEMGMFHKTLARNIALQVETDSVVLIQNGSTDSLQLKLFFTITGRSDSTILTIAQNAAENSSKEIKQIRN